MGRRNLWVRSSIGGATIGRRRQSRRQLHMCVGAVAVGLSRRRRIVGFSRRRERAVACEQSESSSRDGRNVKDVAHFERSLRGWLRAPKGKGYTRLVTRKSRTTRPVRRLGATSRSCFCFRDLLVTLSI